MFVGMKEKHKKRMVGSRERERSVWDVPKDTDMRYDKSAGLQSPTMCGNTYVYESSGTDTDRGEPGSTGESQVGKRGYAGMRARQGWSITKMIYMRGTSTNQLTGKAKTDL